MNTLKELIGSDAGRTLKNLQRREKCENDFFKFCTTYLPHYFNKPNAEYQKILIDIANTNALTKENIEKLKPLIAEKYHTLLIETAKIKTVVDIEPRGFSKSTRWTLLIHCGDCYIKKIISFVFFVQVKKKQTKQSKI